MSAGLDNFAPRVGGVFRLNDKTVFRSGYGITYNAQAWARAVRGDNDYPVTIASNVPERRAVRCRTEPCSRAFRSWRVRT